MGVDVRFLEPSCAEDEAFVAHIVAMVNEAYDTAERGLWRPGVTRTSVAEMSEQIRRGEIVVAVDGGRVVGAVMATFEAGHGWFGGLTTDPAVRGSGVGSALVAFVHAIAAERGCSHMRIERLAPPSDHAHTTRVANWYANLGYVEVSRMPFADFEPEAAGYLLEACEVVMCERPLP